MSMMDIPNSVEATVDRFEGDYAILRLADSQEIIWPADLVPEELDEGAVVRLALIADGEETEERRTAAQDILNEIFSDEEEM